MTSLQQLTGDRTKVILKPLCDCFHSYISPRSHGRQCITRIPGQVHREVDADWLFPDAPPTGSVVPGLYVSRRHEGPASQTAFRLHPNFIHRWGAEGGSAGAEGEENKRHRPRARTSLTAEFVVSLRLVRRRLTAAMSGLPLQVKSHLNSVSQRDMGNTTVTQQRCGNSCHFATIAGVSRRRLALPAGPARLNSYWVIVKVHPEVQVIQI